MQQCVIWPATDRNAGDGRKLSVVTSTDLFSTLRRESPLYIQYIGFYNLDGPCVFIFIFLLFINYGITLPGYLSDEAEL
jgi:hypothetical protein